MVSETLRGGLTMLKDPSENFKAAALDSRDSYDTITIRIVGCLRRAIVRASV